VAVKHGKNLFEGGLMAVWEEFVFAKALILQFSNLYFSKMSFSKNLVREEFSHKKEQKKCIFVENMFWTNQNRSKCVFFYQKRI
jgi:hypothetical protein